MSGEPTRAELTAERDALAAALAEARRVLSFARDAAEAWGTASRDDDGPDMDRMERAMEALADEAGDWTLDGPLTTHDALAAERDLARRERDEERAKATELREDLRKLRYCVVANAGRRPLRRAPRWALVRDAAGVGGTTASRMCVEAGFDPDEVLK